MTALARATDAQIDAICGAFASVSWPVGRADFMALAERLGWQLKLETSSGVHHRSGYSVNLPTVRSLVVDSELSQVTVAVSDKSDDRSELQSAARGLQSAVAGCLGEPSGSEGADRFWELDNGGRIWLATIPKKVLLIVEDQRFADVERLEERLGIDPGRVPSGDDIA